MDAEAALPVRLYYDFAASVCFIAHRVLDRIAPDIALLEAPPQWTPVELAHWMDWWRSGWRSNVRLAMPVWRWQPVPRPSCATAGLSAAFRGTTT
jgi:hypothetical protein